MEGTLLEVATGSSAAAVGRRRAALLLVALTLLPACTTTATRDRIESLEERIAELEAEAATTTTVAPTTATTTTTAPSPNSIAALAAEVGPSVVQVETDVALGAGVIYTDDGLVLTVAHVVAGATVVTIRLADGRALEAEVVGEHEGTDVAVIRVLDPPADLVVAELAVGVRPAVGDPVIVIGSPFGFEQSVTAGIVSAVDRIIDGIVMLQTDAAINEGNSGGPVIDDSGRVLALSSLLFSDTGASTGVGFGVAIDLVVIVAEQLLAGEEVRLGFIGVLVDLGGPGALVADVTTASPAEDAGIQVGDVIVEFDGRPVGDPEDLGAMVRTRLPGELVTLGVVRDGTRLSIDVTLGSTPG